MFHGLGDDFIDVPPNDFSALDVSVPTSLPEMPTDPGMDLSLPAGMTMLDTSGTGMVSATEIQVPLNIFDAQQASEAATATAALSAVNDAPISAADVTRLKNLGVDVSNIVTTGGAAYKLVQQVNGSYKAQPTNAAALASVNAGKTNQTTFMYAGLALLAFFALKG
jgi:hypothetical protein